MQRGQSQFNREAYGLLRSAVLPAIGVLASPAPNAKYSARDVMDVALSQCDANAFVAPAVRKMRKRGADVMTRQRFIQLLRAPGPDGMLEVCGDMLDAGVRQLAEAGRLNGKLTVAVDEHRMPYYGRKSPDARGGKKKDGTNWFERCMTVQVVSGKSPVTLSAYRIGKEESQTRHLGAPMGNALRAGADINAPLPDGGFNSVANMPEMEARGVRHVMPKSGDPRACRAMEEAEADPGKAVREYAIKAKDGRTATANMIIVPKKLKPCRAKCGKCKECKPVLMKDRYVAFLTNITVDRPKMLLKYVPKKYRSRWGIETGYRSIESVRARTKSHSMEARLFPFHFTLVVVNFWLYCKAVWTPYWDPVPEMPLGDCLDCPWQRVTRGGPS